MADDLLSQSSVPEAQVDLPEGDLAGDVPDEAPSIQDEMQEIVERMERGESPEAEKDETEAKPAADAKVTRGEDGKFAKAAPVDEAKAVAGEFVDKGPPATWRAAAKAHWDDVSLELKAEIYKREQDVFQGIGQYQAKAQVADTLMQAIQPYQPIIAALGADVPTALNEVLRTAAIFHVGTPAQKLATLKQIAQTHGIDIGSAAGNTAGADRFADPAVEELRQQLAQLGGFLANQQRAAQNSEAQSAWGEIVAFGTDTSHKYFEDVRVQMGQLINAGFASTLAEAYDKACKLNPQVAAAMDAEAASAQARKANEERARRAKDARRAGNLGVRSVPAPRPVGNGQGSIDDTLLATYEAMNAKG